MRKIISFILCAAMVLSFSSVTAFADEITYKDISILADELAGTADENVKTIQKALDEARNNATDEKRYRIYLPKGRFNLNSTLNIFSNTELYLDDETTLIQTAPKGQNIIKSGDFGQNHILYNGFRNIKIEGGTWNMSNNGSCAMRFGHCTNLSINKVKIHSVKDAHHIEVAGADTVSITNSVFTNGVRSATSNNSCEAIQLDILHDSAHFVGFEEFDDTPNKNITISGCVFDDLYSGIGTRSGVVSKYFDNIVIENNVFTNIQEKAISCFNYKNSKIINNTFSDVSAGISFEYLPNNIFKYNYSQRMYIPNDGKVGSINSKSSTVISGNVMNIKLKSGESSYGIYAYGGKIDAQTAAGKGVINCAGDYTISDLSISNNTVNCSSSESRGIFVTGVNNSEIVSNRLTDYASAESGINAVNICASSKNIVEGNVIDGNFNNGISIYNANSLSSKNIDIDNNSITNIKSYGIRVANDSFAVIKSSNNISAGTSTICLYSKNYSQNLANVTLASTSFSLRNKPLITLSSVNGNTGYKVYRALYNGTYKQIATAQGLKFEDKSAGAYSRNFYRIAPYTKVAKSEIIGKNYIDVAF